VDKEQDVCELLLRMQRDSMLPGLVFHLNSFEAIRLFKSLIAGLEYRQKVDFPTYYMDLQAEKSRASNLASKKEKDCGGNEKMLEEQMKSGEIESEVGDGYA
jgi:hypothetical protein